MQQIQIEKTLDVEVVEHELAELWNQTAGDLDADDVAAVLRARVANLLVFVTNDAVMDDLDQMMLALTAIHPSRVLTMLAERDATDRDIEMYVNTFCQTDKRTGAKRLCCEQVALKARGVFAVELPSAALPLVVPDLPIFLWWRDELHVSDKILDTLLRASDRLIIDSAEFADPSSDLLETNKLFTVGNYSHVGISDINWARLTSWRGLLADFYDVPPYQTWLDEIDYARIDYVAPAPGPAPVNPQAAPQALLMAGWLASRLGWTLQSEQPPQKHDKTVSFKFQGRDRGGSPTMREGVGDRQIKLELNRVERGELKPGRLVQVELQANFEKPASFNVVRSADGLHLQTEAKLGPETHRGRVLPVRNRSAAQLLSREMEILCNDNIYQEALAVATTLIDRSR